MHFCPYSQWDLCSRDVGATKVVAPPEQELAERD
jgi:hypothetical protein